MAGEPHLARFAFAKLNNDYDWNGILPYDTEGNLFGEELGRLVSYFKLPDDAVRVKVLYIENSSRIRTEEISVLNEPTMAFQIDGSTNDVGELKVSVYS